MDPRDLRDVLPQRPLGLDEDVVGNIVDLALDCEVAE